MKKLKLDSFESKKLEQKQLFPIKGGLRSSTNSFGNATRTTGGDADTATSDQDDDPNVPPT